MTGTHANPQAGTSIHRSCILCPRVLCKGQWTGPCMSDYWSLGRFKATECSCKQLRVKRHHDISPHTEMCESRTLIPFSFLCEPA